MGSHPKLFLTGASGLLGRAVFKKFQGNGWNIFGTAFSRASPELHVVDLRDWKAVETALNDFKPHFIIHAAAQRYPEKVEEFPEDAQLLNVDSTKHLAEYAATLSIPVLYISTDYVFDGLDPPYKVEDKPNPLNLYGKLKLKGEQATLKAKPGNIVLRIPVLYGPVKQLSESAVTVLVKNLLNTSQSSNVSNYEKRCPSHVDDIADICFQLLSKKREGIDVSGIFHWCGNEELTKYGMILIMAEVFHLSHSHIHPESTPPGPGGLGAIARPHDTRLDTTRLQCLGIKSHTNFKEGIRPVLEPWIVCGKLNVPLQT